jgi:hypothetical protein
LGRTTVQDEATMLRMAGGRAPEAREDGAEEEEDGAAAAEPRRLGRPGQVGEEAARVFGADGGVAGGEGVSGFREAGGSGESRGAEDGGPRGRRQSGRMMAATEEEEDTTTTMAADRGRKSG